MWRAKGINAIENTTIRAKSDKYIGPVKCCIMFGNTNNDLLDGFDFRIPFFQSR